MASFTEKDPHSLTEILRVVAIGARIERRKSRGKSVRQLENRVDRIREQAEQREQAARLAREKARKKK